MPHTSYRAEKRLHLHTPYGTGHRRRKNPICAQKEKVGSRRRCGRMEGLVLNATHAASSFKTAKKSALHVRIRAIRLFAVSAALSLKKNWEVKHE